MKNTDDQKVITFYSSLLNEGDEQEYLEIIDHFQSENADMGLLMKIEMQIASGQNQKTLQIWDENFYTSEDIISDIVLMGIYINLGEIHQAQEIQVFWQKKMDKLEEHPLLNLFFGWYFYHLGNLYFHQDEFEIAIHHFGKSDSYFVKTKFYFGQYVVQERIATSMEAVGAYGDARYHLREMLRRKGYTPSNEKICNNLLKQVNLYIRTKNYERAHEKLEEAKQLVSKLYNPQLELKLTELLKPYQDQLVSNDYTVDNYQM